MTETNQEATTFHLEVDLSQLAGTPHEELSRILRYWAGNLKHYPLEPGTSESLYDSAYTSVGTWKIT